MLLTNASAADASCSTAKPLHAALLQLTGMKNNISLNLAELNPLIRSVLIYAVCFEVNKKTFCCGPLWKLLIIT